MFSSLNRRDFVRTTAAAGAGLLLGGSLQESVAARKGPKFRISLAEWSLHRTIRTGKLDNRDFVKFSKDEFGIDAIEYVNQFFKDKANDKAYLKELKQRAKDEGVKTLLIMIDDEGKLGDPDESQRANCLSFYIVKLSMEVLYRVSASAMSQKMCSVLAS